MLTSKKYLFIIFFTLSYVGHTVCHAEIIKDIKIEGNKKIGEEAIRSKITNEVGKLYSKNKVTDDLKKIFEMGHFYDIEIHKAPGVLRYVVVEKPSVSEIIFEGNKKIDSDELFEISELSKDEFLDISKVNDAISNMLELYESKGFFLANILYEIKEQDKDSVELIFKISENKKVKVKKINILGNNSITDEIIKSNMLTKEKTFFSIISGGGLYSKAAFERDIQAIKYLYYNEGFIEASVKDYQIFISPNKKDIMINMQIEEGVQHTVGQINFSGDLLFTIDQFTERIKTESGKTFAYNVLQNDLSSLQAMYGDLGYAFVNIIPGTNVDNENNLIDIDFSIDKGEKVHFGQFNIVGNQSTRDKVIRREMSILEGELYNETNKRRSLEDIKRLGFFSDVNFQQKIDPENPSVVNYDLVVEERKTGSLQVTGGYGSSSKLIFSGMVGKTNLFGKGQSFSLNANASELETIFSLNFTEPYLLDTKLSSGLELYKTEYRIQDQYKDFRTGGALRLGHPLTKYFHSFIKYSYEDVGIEILKDSLFDANDEEEAEGISSSVTLSFEYDKRNDRWMPSDGLFTSASLKYVGLGGDKKYTERSFNVRFYKPVWRRLILRNNLTYSNLLPFNNERIPFNELYRLGGSNTLRGFEWFGIGKTVKRVVRRDAEENEAEEENESTREYEDIVRGGTSQMFYNIELQFPMVDSNGIFGVIFYDIGMAEDKLKLENLRSNFGLGLRWFSPMGPLRFEWGFPVDRRQGEDSSQFQFSMGTPF